MSPLFSLGSQNPDDPDPPALLGILGHLAKRLGLIVAAVLTGLVIWLVGVASTHKRTALSPSDADERVPPDLGHDRTFNRPRNLNGKVVIIFHRYFDNPLMGNHKAFELLRMKPEDATRPAIAGLLGIPVEQVAPDRTLVELLIAEMDPELKARLIAELGAESATPQEIQAAVRSLGIEEKNLFIISRRVPVTLQMLQRGSPDPEVKTFLDTARVYAWNQVPGHDHPLPENHTARRAWISLPPARPVFLEVNVRSWSPGVLPLSVRRGAVHP
jgi:hypothetical protein